MQDNTENSGMKPVRTVRAGIVRASVWRNLKATKDGGEFEAFNVTVNRRYRDRDGKWSNGHSFGINDIPKAILALSKAYEYLVLEDKEENVVEQQPA